MDPETYLTREIRTGVVRHILLHSYALTLSSTGCRDGIGAQFVFFRVSTGLMLSSGSNGVDGSAVSDTRPERN